MKKIILRNDPGKKRKKLDKVKDLFEQMEQLEQIADELLLIDKRGLDEILQD